MAIKKKPVDVVCVGFGWVGSIMAQELTDEGLNVLALERGQWRETYPDFAYPKMMDELRYSVRHELQQDLSKETLTFRWKPDQQALPMRQLGSFLLGTDVGGAGVHWNGQYFRALPDDLRYRSWVIERYGRDKIPEGMTIQDWGITYDELEPHFTKWEAVLGIAGNAGNVRGPHRPGGNPFSGWHSKEYPLPPLERVKTTQMFNDAAEKVGMHPFPAPAANASRAYENPYGCRLAPCTYCGFCEYFGCYVYAKSSPQVCINPVLMHKPNFELRTGAHVTRINLTDDGKHATGVTYVDSDGTEVEQPADLVILGAFTTHNVQLLLVSGIGEPYDWRTGTGVTGKNYSYQMTSSISLFFEDELFNPYVGAGALGQICDDYQTANMDHTGQDFIGGGYIALWQTGGRPINQLIVPGDVPDWGAKWKQAAAKWYSHSTAIATHGSVMSYRDAFLDLDPAYKDNWGMPLLRMTFDWHRNEHEMTKYVTHQAEKIAKAMGPTQMFTDMRLKHYDIRPYQTTHNVGGAIMGSNPRESVLNKYLQCWDVPNVFVPGSNAFPQNIGYNPTATMGALTYHCVDAIRRHYLRDPGPLVRT